MLPLAYDSAIEVGKFRKRIAEKISTGAPKEEIINWISRNFNLTKQASFSIYTYILEQYLFTGGAGLRHNRKTKMTIAKKNAGLGC